MAANTNITVTSLNFDDIKENLKNFLKAKPEFQDYNFQGSVINTLLDVLAYNTYQQSYYTNMVGNEMFLDSATLRPNVISRAKMLGYTPRSARGAQVEATVTLSGVSSSLTSVTIPSNTSFTTTIDGEDYIFSTNKDNLALSSNNYSANVILTEGQSLSHKYTSDGTNPQRYIIPNENVDTTSLEVVVQGSSSDTDTLIYTLAEDITEVKANSAVYFLHEADANKYEVVFGDNILGRSPVQDNIVILNYKVCRGSEGNNILPANFTAPSTIASYSFTSSINDQSHSGANNESIDSVKFNAPKNFETQNRAVVADDYKRIILRENADLASISVWGGEENTPAVYGKVYISVKPTNGTVISSDKKNAIKGLLKKYNTLSIDPEFVDASYLYINPTIKARYNPDSTTLSASGIQTKIVNAVSTFEDNTLGTFDNKRFRYSQFTKEMDKADDSILSNETIIKIEKRFAPSTTTAATYTLAFNNSFHHPHEGHASVIDSTTFTFQGQTCKFDDDGYGNIRIYYVDVAQNANVYLNRTAGSVDYTNGTVTFDGFLPTAYTGSEISIIANPNSNDVTALRNQIMLIAGATVTVINDASEVIAANTITATTSGVTTTTTESGIYSTVY